MFLKVKTQIIFDLMFFIILFLTQPRTIKISLIQKIIEYYYKNTDWGGKGSFFLLLSEFLFCLLKLF